ncbi:hypothetical protein [Nocardia sp. NPDC024068]|uniref:hypothetical protein n=1 Tax=Nocardia sp. NPDC024068 TaxID=3157197 RepID=UPI0033F1F4B8
MDLNRYTDRIRADLVAAATLGDEKTQATAEALATAVENSARLALLSALTELADTVTAELGDRTVRVSLHGTEATVDVSRAATGDNPSFEEMTGDISRVTLRLVEQVKSRAEEAAAQSGQSLNSWMSGVVSGALRDQMRGGYGGGKGGGFGGTTKGGDSV